MQAGPRPRRSFRVRPYVSTPGRSETSPIQRPSASRSKSTVSVKWPTLTPANVHPADDDERRRTYRDRVRASTALALDEYAATLAKLAK